MNQFRRCLVELDAATVMEMWETVFPGQRRPKDHDEALMVLHYARTQAESVPLDMRVYSHRWLFERGLSSGLPDQLRPNAEQAVSRIVEAVGISVKSISEAGVPLAKAIEQAMSEAVLEAYADGNRDPDFIKTRMSEARARVMRS